jgi:predicted dehydrogenase
MFEKEKLDFISVCTPNYLHAPVTIAALERGIHVHCEKPIAMNAEETKDIIAARDRSGKKVMIGLGNRFTGETLLVRKLAAQGFLGEIYHARCGWRRRNGIPGRGGWFPDKRLAGGGALIDLGMHSLDLVMYFLDFPEVSEVMGNTYSKFGNSPTRLRQGYRDRGEGAFDVEDMAVGLIRLKNGTTVDFEISWASNVEKETKYYELLGTKGGVSFMNGELKIHSELMGTSVNMSPDPGTPLKSESEFRHFIDCVKGDAKPRASLDQGLQLMRIIDAIYESSETGRGVRID